MPELNGFIYTREDDESLYYTYNTSYKVDSCTPTCKGRTCDAQNFNSCTETFEELTFVFKYRSICFGKTNLKQNIYQDCAELSAPPPITIGSGYIY